MQGINMGPNLIEKAKVECLFGYSFQGILWERVLNHKESL
jgi:hypothetical protein